MHAVLCRARSCLSIQIGGAAGAVEAIASVLPIVHGVVPPTINLDAIVPDSDLIVRIAVGRRLRNYRGRTEYVKLAEPDP